MDRPLLPPACTKEKRLARAKYGGRFGAAVSIVEIVAQLDGKHCSTSEAATPNLFINNGLSELIRHPFEVWVSTGYNKQGARSLPLSVSPSPIDRDRIIGRKSIQLRRQKRHPSFCFSRKDGHRMLDPIPI